MHLIRHAALMTMGMALLVTCAACQVERDPNRNSGDDHLRTKAIEMPLNKVVIDHVDVVGGDQDDWKYFTVISPGLVKIVANFDNPEAQARIFVLNAVGQVLSDLDLPESTKQVRQLQFQADPGNFYLHIGAEELATDYSVEVVFKEL